MGVGGCWSRPQVAHWRTRRAPCPAPSKKKLLSGVIDGLGRATGGGLPGLVPQRPEAHRGDRLVIDGVRIECGHEVSAAKRGLLLPGDGLDHAALHRHVAQPQVTYVRLLAIGGNDRRAAQFGEQVIQPGSGSRVRFGIEFAHAPGLQHRRWRDLVRTWRVARIVVAHRRAPVPDHRRVHAVSRPARTDQLGAGQLLKLRNGGGAHREPSCTPRACVTISSRWISFTPPPKVLICA